MAEDELDPAYEPPPPPPPPARDSKSPKSDKGDGRPPTPPSTVILPADGVSIGSDDDEFEFDPVGAEADTVSITSSIYAHAYERGRRYHRYKHGRYPIPNDDMEQEREDMKHAMMLELTDGALFYAPVGSHPQKILDVGTGTGIWAVSVGFEYPSAVVQGIDLSPIQPIWVPPNVRFLVDDCEDEWLEGDYDLVHFRCVALILKNVPRVMGYAFENIKPGGWIELQEICYEPMCDDDTMKDDDPIKFMYDKVVEAFARLGSDFALPPKLGGFLRDAGFEDVRCVVKKLPLGTWPLDKTYRLVGLYQKMSILDIMPAFNNLLQKALGMSQIEAEMVLSPVRKSVDDRSIHRYVRYYFWYARKPYAS